MSGHNAHGQLYDGEATIPDPGNGNAIVAGKSLGIVNLVTTAAETRTLSDPTKEGVVLTLCLDTDGGDCVITAATAINAAGNTIMTFADASDVIQLTSVKTGSSYKWRVTGNDGVALS